MIKNRHSHLATHHLIGHLVLSDLLYVTQSLITLIIIFYLPDVNENWSFSLRDTTCKLGIFVWIICYSTSVGTLTVMSIERYRTIIHPTLPKLFGKKLRLVLLLVWVVSILLASPSISLAGADRYNKYDCILDNQGPKYLIRAYATILNLMDYVIPLSIMLYCYTKIVIKLRKTALVTSRLKKSLTDGDRHVQRVIKMLVFVTVSFIITALPWTLGISLIAYSPFNNTETLITHDETLSIVSQVAQVLSLSSPLYDPIMYIIANQNFRRDLCQWHSEQKSPIIHIRAS
ncbi:Neuropeptide FF receptor 2 [Trichoplax sp. H2]|nr:Neuropeptide FF receptor 2 [Trichoplax sp. H2]|eukprot:RDD39882.1 Neuropeptide FF receptor 2 [Trichoplax sp. H2]